MKIKKLNKVVAAVATLSLALALTACGGVKIQSIELPTEMTVEKGSDVVLELKYAAGDAEADAIEKAAAKLGEVQWTTSDEAIVAIDEDGNVVAVETGEADVTATVGEFSATCKVTVVVAPTEINVPENLELTIGDEGKALNAKVLPEDATEVEMTYTSSDEKVATVDENGTVTAVGAGECVITTKAANVEAETKVVVKDAKQPETTNKNAAASKKEDKPASSNKNDKTPVKNDSKPSSDKGNKPSTDKGNSGSTNKPAAPAPAPEQPAEQPAAPAPAPAQPAPAPEQPAAPAPAPEKPAQKPAPAPTVKPDPPKPDENGVISGTDGNNVGHIDLEDGHWSTDTGATRS